MLSLRVDQMWSPLQSPQLSDLRVVTVRHGFNLPTGHCLHKAASTRFIPSQRWHRRKWRTKDMGRGMRRWGRIWDVFVPWTHGIFISTKCYLQLELSQQQWMVADTITRLGVLSLQATFFSFSLSVPPPPPGDATSRGSDMFYCYYIFLF